MTTGKHYFQRPTRKQDKGNRRVTGHIREQVHQVFVIAKSENAIEWERSYRDRLAAAQRVAWEQGTMK